MGFFCWKFYVPQLVRTEACLYRVVLQFYARHAINTKWFCSAATRANTFENNLCPMKLVFANPTGKKSGDGILRGSVRLECLRRVTLKSFLSETGKLRETHLKPLTISRVRLGTRNSVAYTFGGGSLVLRKNASRNSNASDNVDGVLPGGWGSSGITGEMSKTTICMKTDFEFYSFGFFFFCGLYLI